MSYQIYRPTPQAVWRNSEESALQRAIDLFGGGCLSRGVSWGVRRKALPIRAALRDYVVINYNSLNEYAVAAGFVVAMFDYPTGKGMVIRLMETKNGFNIQPPHGWRYVSLWIPNKQNATCGFI